MTPLRRQEELELMLRRILQEFEPSSPKCLEAYAESGDGVVLQSVTTTDAFSALLEEAETLLENCGGEEEE